MLISRRVWIGLAVVTAFVVAPGVASADGGGTVNATVRVFPMVLSLSEIPDEVEVGDRFKLTATIRNLSVENMRQVVATADFDAALVDLRGPVDKHYGAVTSRRSKSATWAFTAIAPGTLRITVTVSALDPDTGLAITTGQPVEVLMVGSAETTDDGLGELDDDDRGGPPWGPPVPPIDDVPAPPENGSLTTITNDRRPERAGRISDSKS